MKEAYYYAKVEDGKVQCALCPHCCNLKIGQYGICNSRKNVDGVLIATSYGNLCSIGIDPVEKKPLMQFLPGTTTYSVSSAGCNLRCLHCQNDGISQAKPEQITVYKLEPPDVVKNAIESGCKSISYTYTEPTTFYEFMIDTAKLAQQAGLKNISVSNGYINEWPLEELCKYVDAFNIDLKYFSDDLYYEISKGSLEPILRTLEIIKENNRWLEITNLIIPDINDNKTMIKEMCEWLVSKGFSKYPLHFSRFYPHYRMSDKQWTPMETVFKANEIAINAGMKYVYLGNVPDEYNGDLKCPRCKRNLIVRSGYRMIENNLAGGKCVCCGENIDGIF
jgi:pyruvate formate lyase activating enzyme